MYILYGTHNAIIQYIRAARGHQRALESAEACWREEKGMYYTLFFYPLDVTCI